MAAAIGMGHLFSQALQDVAGYRNDTRYRNPLLRGDLSHPPVTPLAQGSQVVHREVIPLGQCIKTSLCRGRGRRFRTAQRLCRTYVVSGR